MGIRPLQLGKPSVNSSMVAMPTVVALRPVSNDARVGEHSAVVWNCDSRTPRSAMRLMVGISTRPPKQSHVAMPVSSHTRYKMFGASSGAVGAAYGPQSGSESRMSSSILPLKPLDSFDPFFIEASLPLASSPASRESTPAGLCAGAKTQKPRDTRRAGLCAAEQKGSSRPLLRLLEDLH